jgi:hypothetical protein
MPPLLPVLHDDQWAGIAEQIHYLQPVLEVGVLLTLVRDQRVHRSFCKEELVGRVVYLLASEVPDVDPEITTEQLLAGLVAHAYARRELPRQHVDPFSGILSSVQRIIRVQDFFRERRLASSGFPNDQELCLSEIINTCIAFL